MPIIHNDIFSFLALELGGTGQELKDLLCSDATHIFCVLEQLEHSILTELELTLAEPVVNPRDGAVLLAQHSRMTPRYVKALLTRQLQEEGETLGPICVTPTEQALTHYRNKIAKRLTSIVNQVRDAKERDAAPIHRRISATEELKAVGTHFQEALDTLIGSADFLPALLTSLQASHADGVLAASVDSTLVAMAVLSYHPEGPGPDTRQEELRTLGTAGLLQDISYLLDPSVGVQDHPKKSAEVALGIGAGGAVAQIIRSHHQILGPDGQPERLGSSPLSVNQRVLITANLFLDQLKKGAGFETVKSLNWAAEAGYVDREAVRILGRLYLPRVKSYVIEAANKIGTGCPEVRTRPLLWPVGGDKMPSIFLCRNETCAHKTSQVSQIARTVPFEVDGVAVGSIEAGLYFTCPPLTRQLKSLYEAIQAQAASRATTAPPGNGPATR